MAASLSLGPSTSAGGELTYMAQSQNPGTLEPQHRCIVNVYSLNIVIIGVEPSGGGWFSTI